MNRQDDMVITRICIGYSRLKHLHLLDQERDQNVYFFTVQNK